MSRVADAKVFVLLSSEEKMAGLWVQVVEVRSLVEQRATGIDRQNGIFKLQNTTNTILTIRLTVLELKLHKRPDESSLSTEDGSVHAHLGLSNCLAFSRVISYIFAVSAF